MRTRGTLTALQSRLALWAVLHSADVTAWHAGVQLHRLLSSACSGSSAETAADPLSPGAAFSMTKRFTLSDTASWAALTGDSNPIHADGSAAAAAGLAEPILPGMLLAALFPAIIGSRFPGSVYLSQTLKFAQYAPVSQERDGWLLRAATSAACGGWQAGAPCPLHGCIRLQARSILCNPKVSHP